MAKNALARKVAARNKQNASNARQYAAVRKWQGESADAVKKANRILKSGRSSGTGTSVIKGSSVGGHPAVMTRHSNGMVEVSYASRDGKSTYTHSNVKNNHRSSTLNEGHRSDSKNKEVYSRSTSGGKKSGKKSSTGKSSG